MKPVIQVKKSLLDRALKTSKRWEWVKTLLFFSMSHHVRKNALLLVNDNCDMHIKFVNLLPCYIFLRYFARSVYLKCTYLLQFLFHLWTNPNPQVLNPSPREQNPAVFPHKLAGLNDMVSGADETAAAAWNPALRGFIFTTSGNLKARNEAFAPLIKEDNEAQAKEY